MALLNDPIKICSQARSSINYWSVGWIFFLSLSLQAQVSQPARYEKEQKSSYRDFTVISMGEQGIALIRDKQKFARGENSWEVILLDSSLNESITKEINVENRYTLIGHDYRDRAVYFLFRMGETDQGKFKIIKIDCLTGQSEEHNYEPELTIRLTHFNVVANQVILAGYVSNQPTVLLYNLSNDHAKIIPGLLISESELLDVRVNVNETFNVLIAERKSKIKKRLVIKTFDVSGTMLLDDTIEIDPDKTILSASTSSLVRDELIIMGTWGEGVMKQSSGLFTVLVDPYTDQKINFYDFAQLNHFLDYLSPKRAAKTKAKSDERRKMGKIPEFKAYVLPARLEESKEGFMFYSEVYHTTANLNGNRWSGSPYNNNPYLPFGNNPYGYNPYRIYNTPYNYGFPYNSTNNSSQEAKMLHASIAVFDSKGTLTADHGLKLQDLKLNSAEQLADFVHTPTRFTLVFGKEKEIVTQTSQRDGFVLSSEKVLIQLNSPIETLRSDNDEIIVSRYWYKNSLFLFGYQTVKNMEKGNRDIFFINKVKID